MRNALKNGLCVVFIVIRYLFVERAGPMIFIRGHSLSASGFLCMH